MSKETTKSITKPMTTAEFFDKVCSILKENNQMPDILDYGIADSDAVPITTYEFDLCNNLDYGGNEGIYLDLYIRQYDDKSGTEIKHRLGTFKTLEETHEAMRIMAQLLADFIVAEREYVKSNFDDFTWEGVNVYSMRDGKRLNYNCTCSTMDTAIKLKDKLLEEYEQVVIRNNETREEKVYSKDNLLLKALKDCII